MKKVALAAVLLLACGHPTHRPFEQCHNGVDDNGNGLIDCADPDCASDTGCVNVQDAGYYGSCPRCGTPCQSQQGCVDMSWSFDNPLAACSGGYCRNYTEGIQLDVQIDTDVNWTGFLYPIQSTNIRFISKTAVDGSAVSCATVRASAMGYMPGDADQIEKSNRFNIVGFDARKVTAQGGQMIPEHFVNVNVGGDFLLWVELWGGLPDSSTHLPTGNRFGWGCFETGAPVAAVVPGDTCMPGADSGTCRLIEIQMPPPSM